MREREREEEEKMNRSRVGTWHPNLRKTPSGGKMMAKRMSMQVAVPSLAIFCGRNRKQFTTKWRELGRRRRRR